MPALLEVGRRAGCPARLRVAASTLLLLFAPCPRATATPADGWVPTVLADLRRGGTDFLQFAAAPASWGRSAWTRLLLSSAAVGAAVALDEDVRTEAQQSRSGSTENLANLFDGGGNPVGWGGAVVAATYLGGLATGSEELRTTGLFMAEAALFSTTVVAGLKVAAGRARPEQEDSSTSARPLRGGVVGDHSSFPSQHTTFAFAVATVAAERIGPGAGWFLYPAAALVGLSRIHDDQHWASDTLAGALIGTATGLWVVRPRDDTQRTRPLRAAPWSTGAAWGVLVSGSF